ncbi:helix-turn-helix domain-containing protein [Flammeovirga agarivorans]|uniref:Helix-turn-helix transcriptional regulator n=1 Tax=Flammeovirga agarivorans TaxID=2726742 RepID=A0A7X8SJX6_9BACT|nr:AraC family transcriptional regulator [Flammeovirga agarivorans]NLR91540.1 helix-turn-helix transcriptional regulator [Flammeovirga agarivorans]
MSYTSNHHKNVLELWNEGFQGKVKDNCLVFDNAKGKGSIKKFVFEKEGYEILIFDFNLKEDLSFYREIDFENQYVGIKFTYPGVTKMVSTYLQNDEYSDISNGSFGVICTNFSGQMEWSYNKGVDNKIIIIRIKKTRFLEFSQQYETTRALLDLSKSFFVFEDLNLLMTWYVDEIFRCDETELFHKERLQAISSGLINRFFMSIASRELPNTKDELNKLSRPVLETYEILKKTLDRVIPIEEITREVGLSESRLRYLFKQAFGASVSNYHQKLRLEKSKELLKQNHKTNLQIAMDLGFSSASHYSVAFKKCFKETPNEYRKRIIR